VEPGLEQPKVNNYEASVTVKLPEEGKIWEWRAFGRPDPEFISRVRALPVRDGLVDHPDEDIYLISPSSDQNVKLRRLGDRWVLKFKELIEKGADSIELYREGMDMVYEAPVTGDVLVAAAVLLRTELPGPLSPTERLDQEQIGALFANSTPPIAILTVPKVRSQFLVVGGWVELADVQFARGAKQTISIHSPERQFVEKNLKLLEPAGELSVMNYIDACRTWG